MILLIDNYDSFSYNLYQLVGAVNPNIKVVRNDKITVDEVKSLNPEAIILSPGPGKPCDAGDMEAIIKAFYKIKPILGICLGHQAICEVFGATITYAKQLMHGKISEVELTDDPLFKGIDKHIEVARYHSLVAVDLPECLEIIAKTDDNEVMAVKHKDYPVYGLQFHPESVLTKDGLRIMKNFLGGEKMIKEAIQLLVKNQDLTREQAYQCMDEIMSGETSQILTSSYLTALSMKGETIEEITGSAKSMREHGVKLLNDEEVLEIVGTGGDGAHSFNISTTSSLVIAAAGVKVAKHGNRAASSLSGAADVLEALGVKIDISPAKSTQILNDINICFLFAQTYHTAMRFVAPVRKELGIRTVFNILGPLTNPAGASMQVMGVYSADMVEPLARVLSLLGVKRAMVVYGQDCLDEITSSSDTLVCEINNGDFKTYTITPEEFGFTRCSKDDLLGGTPQENAQITLSVLKGEKGPKRDTVLMNAGAGIYIGGKADTLAEGIEKAAQIIDDGLALEKLDAFVKASNA